MPRKGKHNKSKDNKGKGKEIATLKRQASTHDLRGVARTVDKTGGSSKFSAVIKFSAWSSSSRNTPRDFVDHPEAATETDTSPTTQKKISGEVLARQDVGADNSGVVLENIPSESTVGSQKEGSSCTTGTVQVSGKDLDRSNASSERTSVSKANIEAAKPRPLESIMTNSYPRNAWEHTSVLVGSSVVGIQKGEKISRRNRSITQFCRVLRDMVETAGNSVEYITLFEDPFSDAQRMEEILDKVWRDVEQDHVTDHARDNKIDAYLRSVQSRTRSHIVHEAKKNVAFLYKFDQNASRSFIKKHVTELMKRDRYTCAASHRKTWGYRFIAEEVVELIHKQYFNGKRKLGHVNPRFLKSINGPFLCLVFAALYNALGAWESGECGIGVEFSYINTIDVYKRLYEQWQCYPTRVQVMLVRLTQYDIVEKGQVSGKKVKFEHDKAYHVDAEEIEELAKDLATGLENAGLGTRRAAREEEDEGSMIGEDLWVSAQPTHIVQDDNNDDEDDREGEKENEEPSDSEDTEEDQE
ncbi:hypothetical protein BGX38DRAFT_1272958 [Terfezia claveryi]|nr:hypothetical protein BGX38DRAFT_1272958 [Terfezia claveryi]